MRQQSSDRQKRGKWAEPTETGFISFGNSATSDVIMSGPVISKLPSSSYPCPPVDSMAHAPCMC